MHIDRGPGCPGRELEAGCSVAWEAIPAKPRPREPGEEWAAHLERVFSRRPDLPMRREALPDRRDHRARGHRQDPRSQALPSEPPQVTLARAPPHRRGDDGMTEGRTGRRRTRGKCRKEEPHPQVGPIPRSRTFFTGRRPLLRGWCFLDHPETMGSPFLKPAKRCPTSLLVRFPRTGCRGFGIGPRPRARRTSTRLPGA